MSTLAVTCRFAAPSSMLDVTAGAIARAIFKTTGMLMAKTPLAGQIEAPDPDDKIRFCPFIPVLHLISAAESKAFPMNSSNISILAE